MTEERKLKFSTVGADALGSDYGTITDSTVGSSCRERNNRAKKLKDFTAGVNLGNRHKRTRKT